MFHNHLKALRLKCGLSQKQVADFLSISPQSVSKWEKGEALPSIEFLPKMAECLECDINAFFAKEGKAERNYCLVDSFFALETDVLYNGKNTEAVTAFLIENPDTINVITDLCNVLMEYKTVNVKTVQGILNCNEAEARAFVRHLEGCEMIEKLDIADAYFVIKDAVEGLILLLKTQKELCDITDKLN
ncbi:MAG: helix-turn-helix transcriptional regulator [Oscillospiraceae bacterium]|nr:helix-turn-helix transcriptional regulator [Oscillospiraceae bacterium]